MAYALFGSLAATVLYGTITKMNAFFWGFKLLRGLCQDLNPAVYRRQKKSVSG